jgi:hypothetical protein
MAWTQDVNRVSRRALLLSTQVEPMPSEVPVLVLDVEVVRVFSPLAGHADCLHATVTAAEP